MGSVRDYLFFILIIGLIILYYVFTQHHQLEYFDTDDKKIRRQFKSFTTKVLLTNFIYSHPVFIIGNWLFGRNFNTPKI